MRESEAKRQVIEAGLTLQKRGLIVRTWGNISCRVDAERFAITPSGIGYERLDESLIVIVNCHTLARESDVKPSGETGIHAAVYRQRPDAGFTIHTHQNAASAISLAGADALEPTPEEQRVLGGLVPRAPYGLPCSAPLCARVTKTLKLTGCNVLFMVRHGVLSIGRDRDEAFARAETLERVCERALRTEPPLRPLACGGEALLARAQAAFPEYGYILPCTANEVRRVSEYTSVLCPMLDDFAQLIGTDVRRVPIDASADDLRAAAEGRNALLVRDYGALCLAKTESDALAVSYLLEKECMSRLNARAYGGARCLTPQDRAFMRGVYVNGYSKLK